MQPTEQMLKMVGLKDIRLNALENNGFAKPAYQ